MEGRISFDYLKRRVKVHLDRFLLIEAVKSNIPFQHVKSRGIIFEKTCFQKKYVPLFHHKQRLLLSDKYDGG